MQSFNYYKENFSKILHKLLFEPVSPYPLALLRIFVTAVIIFQVLLILPHFYDYYGDNGIIQRGINDYLIRDAWGQPNLTILQSFFNSIFPLNLSFNHFSFIVFFIYLISLFFLLFGWMTHLFAILSWFLHFTLMNSAPITNYGVDRLAHILLFYFTWMPTARVLSLDYFFLKKSKQADHIRTTSFDTMSLRLSQLHLCLVYFQSGIAKTAGHMWWNGEAIWRSVMSPEYQQFNLSWLAYFPALAFIAGLITLIVEIGYPIFIWFQKTRWIWLIATVFLHIGIAIFQGLWVFALIMIAFNLGSFGISEYFKYSPQFEEIPNKNKSELTYSS